METREALAKLQKQHVELLKSVARFAWLAHASGVSLERTLYDLELFISESEDNLELSKFLTVYATRR